MDVCIKRIYEPAAAADGERVLIDRWFAHDPARFAEFRRRYAAELAAKEDKVVDLRRRAHRGRLTLFSSARDTEHNDAVVLAEVLLQRTAKTKR
jgi:uncharacterized protein YeaO (DUF488 family)